MNILSVFIGRDLSVHDTQRQFLFKLLSLVYWNEVCTKSRIFCNHILTVRNLGSGSGPGVGG